MPQLADLRDMEERIAQVLEESGAPTQEGEPLAEAVVEAVLQLLEDASGEEADLADFDRQRLEEVVREALADAYPRWNDAYRRRISERTAQLVEVTREHYERYDLQPPGLRQAVRRSRRVQQLTKGLNEGMRGINDRLREKTVESMEEAILSGKIDSRKIRARIETEVGTSSFHARIQTQAAVSAYSQEYRNELARRAGIEHFHYADLVRRNTRPFCRINADRVFTRSQIEQMENGMLEPVLSHCGGFNCIHSLTPVNLDGSPRLRAKLVEAEEPTTIQLDTNGRRTITVFANPTRIARLKRQLPMQVKDFQQFLDADESDEGFLALHESWFEALSRDRRFKATKQLLQEMQAARAKAERLVEEGSIVQLVINGNEVRALVDGRLRDL